MFGLGEVSVYSVKRPEGNIVVLMQSAVSSQPLEIQSQADADELLRSLRNQLDSIERRVSDAAAFAFARPEVTKR